MGVEICRGDRGLIRRREKSVVRTKIFKEIWILINILITFKIRLILYILDIYVCKI